jgi:hypothetical protein
MFEKVSVHIEDLTGCLDCPVEPFCDGAEPVLSAVSTTFVGCGASSLFHVPSKQKASLFMWSSFARILGDWRWLAVAAKQRGYAEMFKGLRSLLVANSQGD